MTAVSPITKAARQGHIAEILARAPVKSQDELAELLGQRGVRVAQATLSRDLDELGAVRLRGTDGALVYALPGDPGGPGSRPGGLPGGVGGAHRGEVPGPRRMPGGQPHGADETHERRPAAGVGAEVRLRWLAGGAGPDVRGGSRGPGGHGTAGEDPGAGEPAGQEPAGQEPGEQGPGGRVGADTARGPAGNGTGVRAGGISGALHRAAAELLITAEASANLVVLRTPAGGAQLLASAIDHAGWPSILGTVAGDDTVLVIARDPAGGDEVASALIRLAEGRP